MGLGMAESLIPLPLPFKLQVSPVGVHNHIIDGLMALVGHLTELKPK